MTFRLSPDSSIFISQLTGDVHAEAVLAALMVLETMGAELTLPLLCYAELWTGVELLPEADRPEAAETLDRVLRAGGVLLVADNVAIAREAARGQAAYRRRGGRREVLIPDFVIGANATYYAGRLLTTNPRDFFKAFPTLEILTPQAFFDAVCPYATPPREARVSLPGVCPAYVLPSHVVHCAWHQTSALSKLKSRIGNF